MENITIYQQIANDGAGGVSISYYLHESQAEAMEEMDDEPFGESCIQEIETYVGSNIYTKAIANQSGRYCNKCYNVKMDLDEFIGNDGICKECR